MTRKNGSIRELVESISKFSWAMSALGVSQLVNTFSLNFGRENRRADVTGSFNSIALAAQENLDEPLKSVFLVGDQLQGAVTDLFFNFLTLNSFSSRKAARSVFEILLRSSEIARILMPGNRNPLLLQEIKNKLEAFSFFEYVDEFFPPVAERSLSRMIGSIKSLEPFSFIWAMEGVGHYYMEKVSSVINSPNHLLRSESAGNLARKELIPLHAGMGLSLSGNCLQRIKLENSPEMVAGLLRRHIALCQDNSKNGYAEIAFETLGLVARNLYPHLLLRIDEALRRIDKDFADYFWHGAGRAMYFSPTGLFPVCDENWSSISATQDEPPHESGRLNALTGWLFALALVSLKSSRLASNVTVGCSRFGKRSRAGSDRRWLYGMIRRRIARALKTFWAMHRLVKMKNLKGNGTRLSANPSPSFCGLTGQCRKATANRRVCFAAVE
jgi:hypothetical protein